jgi:hypothetical protein
MKTHTFQQTTHYQCTAPDCSFMFTRTFSETWDNIVDDNIQQEEEIVRDRLAQRVEGTICPKCGSLPQVYREKIIRN